MPTMNEQSERLFSLIIVDARPEDYSVLLREQPATGMFQILTTGEAALQQISKSPMAEWLINLRLPDMTGPQLLCDIRQRRPSAAVSLVGDAYSIRDEISARAVGATAYLCKPFSLSWLSGARLGLHPAIRAGPANAASPAEADPICKPTSQCHHG